MTDELDRQVQEKERRRSEEKDKAMRDEMKDLSYQYSISDHRTRERQHRYAENPKIYQYYSGIVEKQHERARNFDYTQIDLQ